MNENLNAQEPSRDTSEGPPRDPPSDAEVRTSDEAPQQHTDATTDLVSGSLDEPKNDEEL
jgi:hypothetical protein